MLTKKILIILFLTFNLKLALADNKNKLDFNYFWDEGCITTDYDDPFYYIPTACAGHGGCQIKNKLNPKDYLNLWEEVFTKIHEQLPHLSPKEEKWIKEETKLFNKISRQERAKKTDEYALYKMSNIVHEFLYLIKQYKNSDDNTKKKKLFYRIAWNLSEKSYGFSFYFVKLLESKLISNFPKDWRKLHFDDWNNKGRYISQIQRTWNRARNYMIKCHIAGY